jgi:hypothetical protein
MRADNAGLAGALNGVQQQADGLEAHGAPAAGAGNGLANNAHAPAAGAGNGLANNAHAPPAVAAHLQPVAAAAPHNGPGQGVQLGLRRGVMKRRGVGRVVVVPLGQQPRQPQA